MHIHHTTRFTRQLAGLPASVQTRFEEQASRLREQPNDPRLHLKKLQGFGDAYSIRITRNYRALFVWSDDIVLFYGIGDRKDVYGR